MIGDYVPGTSLLHRIAPWVKLLATAVVVTLLGIFPTPQAVLGAVIAMLGLYQWARLPWRTLWAGLRPFLWLAVPLAAFQIWQSGVPRAVAVVGQLLVAVLVGRLIIATTRVSDLVRTLSGAAILLRPWGVRRERVELVLALTIGSILKLTRAATRAREAAQARGTRPRVALVVPAVVVSAVRQADDLAEAMAARGL